MVRYIAERRGKAMDVVSQATPLANTLERLVHDNLRGWEETKLEHFRRVTANALKIFDALIPLAKLAPRFRQVLWAASMLHDIGKARKAGPKHGWWSADMILEAGIGNASHSAAEIAVVASLHRREGMDDKTSAVGEIHGKVLSEFGGEIPKALLILSGILRVADGLDYVGATSITEVQLQGTGLIIHGHGGGFTQNFAKAAHKSPLLTGQLGIGLVMAPPAPVPVAKPDAAAQHRPPTPARPRADRWVVFDLQGTLINHREPRAAVLGMALPAQRKLA